MKIIPVLNIVSKNYLSIAEQQTLEEILKKWEADPSIPNKIISNIKNEHFINEASWVVFIKSLISKKDLPYLKMKQELTNEIIMNHLFQGDKIKIDYPEYIGTVMLYEEFVYNLTTLSNNKSKFARKTYIRENFLKKVFSNQEIDNKYKSVILKDPKRLLWFTFDEMDGITPFPFLSFMSTAEILANLALEDERFKRDTKLAVFIFRSRELIKQNVILFRPTFCDSMFYLYFSPTKSENKYGLTDPIYNEMVTIYGHKIKIEKRPETVVRSEDITLEFLSQAFITY